MQRLTTEILEPKKGNINYLNSYQIATQLMKKDTFKLELLLEQQRKLI